MQDIDYEPRDERKIPFLLRENFSFGLEDRSIKIYYKNSTTKYFILRSYPKKKFQVVIEVFFGYIFHEIEEVHRSLICKNSATDVISKTPNLRWR